MGSPGRPVTQNVENHSHVRSEEISSLRILFQKSGWIFFIQIIFLFFTGSWIYHQEMVQTSSRLATVLGQVDSSFRPPEPGTLVPPLLVGDRHLGVRPLIRNGQQSCVVLIGSCANCSELLLGRCEEMFRHGVPLIVISESSDREIAVQRAAHGWRLPLISVSRLVRLHAFWRRAWRPWVVVLDNGVVSYSQTRGTAWETALQKSGQLLLSRTTDQPTR